jgi:CMP-N,N'-diacetyllegionaminic acid synthase
MFAGKKVLGLIPARGGSKGLPRKNIRNLNGKPLIAWTISEAIQSATFDRLIVSTEDVKIAGIARKYGAEIPFFRPKELATDEARGIDVLFHAMEWFENRRERFDLIVLLQPTSPLRQARDIQNALALLETKQAGAVVSVCECEHPPLWANQIGTDLSMKGFLREDIKDHNRQALDRFYRLNGALYAGQWDFIKKNDGFFGDQTYAYIMSQERSVDIDNELDLEFVRFLIERDLVKFC